MISLMLALLCAPQAAGREAEFEAGWSVVAQYLADAHWDRARERIDLLLAEHGQAPYVMLRRPRIIHALQRIGFWSERRPPKLEDLVSGDLYHWRPNSGQIGIAYGPDELADFWVRDEARGGFSELLATPEPGALLVHPAQFVGPCRLTIEGRSYAPTAALPSVVTCMGVDRLIGVTLGFRARQIGTGRFQATPSIWTEDHGHVQEIAREGTAPVQIGDEYTLTVTVDHASIGASVNGREFMRAGKPRGVYGRIGLSGFTDLTRLTIEGKIEPAWLEGVLDAEVQGQWIDYLRTHEAQADLPDGLRMGRATWAVVLDDPELTQGLEPGVRGQFEALVQLLHQDDFEGAAELAEQLERTEGETRPDLAWLLIDFALARWEAALERADALLARATDPDAREQRGVRRMRVVIQISRGDLPAARELLEREFEMQPDDPWATARLARLELLAGNLQLVDAALRDAAVAGRYTPELDDLNRILSKSRNGPPWRRVHEYRYDRYLIRSDIDRQTCLDASRTLNAALAMFEKWVRPLPGAKRDPFSVYIFSGQWGYLAYAESVLDFAPEHTAGVYSPWLRQLLVWNLPQREEMLGTIQHEGFHQYLDSLVEASPIWLDEGFAELWEAADMKRFDGRRLPTVDEHALVLQAAGAALIPLEEFLYQERHEFLSNPTWNYAQAWALVHMLYEDSVSGRHLLLRLIDLLIEGKSPIEATRSAFERQDLSQLDRKLAEHVRSL